MRQRKLWIVLCLVLFILGLLGSFWALKPLDKNSVEIIQDGNTLYQLDLAHEKDQTIEITYKGRSNIIQIQEGRISMQQAECPDQICVQMGSLRTDGLPIVCLPNRLVIQYSESGADSVSG